MEGQVRSKANRPAGELKPAGTGQGGRRSRRGPGLTDPSEERGLARLPSAERAGERLPASTPRRREGARPRFPSPALRSGAGEKRSPFPCRRRFLRRERPGRGGGCRPPSYPPLT